MAPPPDASPWDCSEPRRPRPSVSPFDDKRTRPIISIGHVGRPLTLYGCVSHVWNELENFRALCTGEKGMGKKGKPLHYAVSTQTNRPQASDMTIRLTRSLPIRVIVSLLLLLYV